MQNQHQEDTGAGLPLSSLRLYVPPLRLASAALWHVVQRRNKMDYGLVEEFVSSVFEMVPDLMSYRERVQLIMGLRAQLVLELFRTDHLANSEAVQSHLNRVRSCINTLRENQVPDPEVEISQSNFLELIQALLKDPVERELFFQRCRLFCGSFYPGWRSCFQHLLFNRQHLGSLRTTLL
ncbi:hypothetical protein DPEC_G00356480 [Dallia pectoralis]|uniref:Uncharacterized protein n=1 Tax=Dallia pectoralis TaxID=75939 RepID=A0ACC2EZT9_DALPE|nr:hypothetical protein DPEC_G00356480 [Dallia pectoralis]